MKVSHLLLQLPDAVSRLTALTELDLHTAAARSQHGVALPQGLPAGGLPRLRVLALTCDAHSPVFAGLAGLTRCVCPALCAVTTTLWFAVTGQLSAVHGRAKAGLSTAGGRERIPLAGSALPTPMGGGTLAGLVSAQ